MCSCEDFPCCGCDDELRDAWLAEQYEFDYFDDMNYFDLRESWDEARADAQVDFLLEDDEFRAAWFDYTDEECV